MSHHLGYEKRAPAGRGSGALRNATTKKPRDQIEDETADVLFILLRFSGRFGIDRGSALRRKMPKNARRYAADNARGSNRMNSEL